MATIALAGCGLAAPSTDPSIASQPEVDRPTGSGELVLRVESRGGLLPPLERERRLPSLSIYGDGLVLVPAAVDGSFPGPAGYPLERFEIDAELLDDIVAAGVGLGLHGGDRHFAQEGPQFVTDASATTITLVTNGSEHVTSADALFDTLEDDTPIRTQLRDFVDRLFALRPTDDDLPEYEPDAYRVFVAAADPGFGADPAAGEPTRWPFEQPLSEWGDSLPDDGLSVNVRCRVVPASEVDEVLDVLQTLTATTVVVDDADEVAIVAYRPVLPGEAGCER